MPHLMVRLFGAPAIEIDGTPVVMSNAKALALLAWLAVTGKPQTRGALAFLLWPDNIHARTHLRGALLALRRALGDGADRWLDDAGDTLAFTPDDSVSVDVVAFRAHVSRIRAHAHPAGTLCPACRQAAAEAVSLYRSDFLADFSLRDAGDFETWLATEREALRMDLASLLTALAECAAAEARWDAAIDYSRRWVALDPLDEAAHRTLMALYYQNGQRSAALRHFDECERLLRAELDVAPEDETTQLAGAIRRGQLPMLAGVQSTSAVERATTTNLPAGLTTLIGREEAEAQIAGLLRRADVRLLTLTGPGGVGKTSLAIAAATALLDDFADGVFFVSLAPVRDAGQVAETITRTLDVREMQQHSALDALRHALRERRLLLLLDNFEHVIAAASLVADLLSACPHLNILVTSRGPLRLYGEHAFAVPLLATPDPAAKLSLDAIAAHSAVQLFGRRAQAVRQDFVLDQRTATPVAQICHRLDGLPLAIELAAARMRHFTAPELLQRFGAAYAGNGEAPSTLHMLTARFPNVPGRHRRLWDTIAWSYDLLAPDEQALFRRLALFVGGWTVEAAQAVCMEGLALECEPSLWMMVDQHLIQRSVAAEDALRFTMLETLREFGLEELRRTGELAPLQRRMADYYTGLAEHAILFLQGAESTAYHRLILADYANIRAVWTWVQAQREVALALRLCSALFVFTNNNAREGEQLALATLDLAAHEPPSPLLVNATMTAGYCSWLLGKLDVAEAYMQRALALDEVIGHRADSAFLGVMRGMLAVRAFDRGDYAAARELFAREDEIMREIGDEWQIAMNIVNWGIIEWRLGEFERGRSMLDESLRLHRRVGQAWGILKALTDRADLHIVCGELDAAASLLVECPPLLHNSDMPDREASYHLSCTRLALARGELGEAADHLAKSFEGHHATGYFYGLEENYLCAAELALRCGRYEQAICLLAGHAAQIRSVGKINDPLRRQKLDAQLADARSRLDPAVADAAWAQGEAMTADELVDYARCEVLEPIGADG